MQGATCNDGAIAPQGQYATFKTSREGFKRTAPITISPFAGDNTMKIAAPTNVNALPDGWSLSSWRKICSIYCKEERKKVDQPRHLLQLDRKMQRFLVSENQETTTTAYTSPGSQLAAVTTKQRQRQYRPTGIAADCTFVLIRLNFEICPDRQQSFMQHVEKSCRQSHSSTSQVWNRSEASIAPPRYVGCRNMYDSGSSNSASEANVSPTKQCDWPHFDRLHLCSQTHDICNKCGVANVNSVRKRLSLFN